MPEDAAVRRAKTLTEIARDALTQENRDPAKPLGLSIGVAMSDPYGRESAASLLERAHTAMYRVKRGSKGSAALAQPFNAAPDADQGTATG